MAGERAQLRVIDGGAKEVAAEPWDLDRLYRDHHERVLRAAYRVTGSLVDAEDVLQTVFLRLSRREVVDLEPHPGSYLHRAAVNAALDLLRQRARSPLRPMGDGGLFVEPDGVASLVAEAPAGVEFDPERQRERQELREVIRRAISALGTRTGEMFVLRYLEGYTNREIAEMMGTSAMVVGVLLHRARARVRRDLAGYLSSAEDLKGESNEEE